MRGQRKKGAKISEVVRRYQELREVARQTRLARLQAVRWPERAQIASSRAWVERRGAV